MSDENQIIIPRSFIELFIPPHAVKPTEPREHSCRISRATVSLGGTPSTR